MERYLRHKQDGTIWPWTPHFAAHADVEEVSEEVAFPERLVPAAQRGRRSRVAFDDGVTTSDPGSGNI